MIGKLAKWLAVGKLIAWWRDRYRHEVECPECGATIRARMADQPENGAGGEPPK